MKAVSNVAVFGPQSMLERANQMMIDGDPVTHVIVAGSIYGGIKVFRSEQL